MTPWSDGERPYVIAELGVNHDGSLRRALALTDAAAEAGADAIKLQYFETDRLMSRAAKLAAYQRAAGETDPVSMLRRLELPLEELAAVGERARTLGMDAILTIFSVELVERAETHAWSAYKTASPDVVNKPLLDALASTGRPLIVSTGAATMQEVARANQWLAGVEAAFLQCVSAYPTPEEFASLGAIPTIAEALDRPVGYSDHTASVQTSASAVRAGAVILEKHLTYDREAPGPDHAASLDQRGFARYAELARRAARVSAGATVGAGQDDRAGHIIERTDKRVLEIERDVRRVSRQSLVAKRRIEPGETITRADLTIKRPGTGLAPWRLEEVIGAEAARAVEADTPIVESDLR